MKNRLLETNITVTSTKTSALRLIYILFRTALPSRIFISILQHKLFIMNHIQKFIKKRYTSICQKKIDDAWGTFHEKLNMAQWSFCDFINEIGKRLLILSVKLNLWQKLTASPGSEIPYSYYWSRVWDTGYI